MSHRTTSANQPAHDPGKTGPGEQPAPNPPCTPAQDERGQMTRTVVGSAVSGTARAVTDWIIDIFRN